MRPLLGALALLLGAQMAFCYYLPGTYPQEFLQGDIIQGVRVLGGAALPYKPGHHAFWSGRSDRGRSGIGHWLLKQQQRKTRPRTGAAANTGAVLTPDGLLRCL